MTVDLTTIRKARPDDQAYIASTWLRSMTHGRATATDAERRAAIDKVLDHNITRVLVACDPKAEHRIRGWLCYAPLIVARVVHYLYVRDGWRKQGIARALMEHAKLLDDRPLLYTHKGPDWASLTTRWRAAPIPLSEVT